VNHFWFLIRWLHLLAMECDFVVVGIGVEPRVGLAECAGLALENGVCV
jgi:NAD(P)H-nitrite reductase large subunit